MRIRGKKPHRGDNVYSSVDEVEKSHVVAATRVLGLVAGANAPQSLFAMMCAINVVAPIGLFTPDLHELCFIGSIVTVLFLNYRLHRCLFRLCFQSHEVSVPDC